MKIAVDVGIIESVEVILPTWAKLIFAGDKDGAVIFLAEDLNISHRLAREIVNGFKREVVYAREYSE